MDKRSIIISPRRIQGLLSAVSIGFFFLLVGAIFVVNSPSGQANLLTKFIAFFRDFAITQVDNLGVYIPAPLHPLSHTSYLDNIAVYLAAEQFSFFWGLFQFIILALRFAAHSPLDKKAEAVSNLVFWIGASFLISSFLLDTRWTAVYPEGPVHAITVWFVFWSMIIMLLGFSLIIRAIALAMAPKKRNLTMG